MSASSKSPENMREGTVFDDADRLWPRKSRAVPEVLVRKTRAALLNSPCEGVVVLTTLASAWTDGKEVRRAGKV